MSFVPPSISNANEIAAGPIAAGPSRSRHAAKVDAIQYVRGIAAMLVVFYHQTVWSFLAFLPVTLSISYVCQRLKSTWPGIISHTIANSAIPVAILRGILS